MLFSSELVKGTLKIIVLKALKCNPRMYGYELAQHVKERTDNRMLVNEGDLYPILNALEAQGLVTTETESRGKRVRKYYSYNHNGNKMIRGKATEINECSKTLKFLLCNEPQTI